MPTALDLTPEEIEAYREAARRRWERERQALARRRERAWEAARRAARLLRERFGAGRVVVFGSLVREECFTPWSDVDIAAWGIRPEDTFRAIGAVLDVDDEIEVNLVDMGACPEWLQPVIEREGVDL
ncbi:MAG: nucleotidyltransferase domain-containing protein [Anaerolineae bacterium]|nr:nucleotidyltransferase domain-containing protein [Anaerolineae bacterium]